MALAAVLGLLGVSAGAGAAAPDPSGAESDVASNRLELGRRMYLEGVLPSGKMMTATVRGDIGVTGEQVICGACHRRSGLGSSEGQEVIPAVTGALLYKPLRLPTRKPPLPPELRPAYTDASLKRAIRDGLGADASALSPFMPRYALNDEELDILLAYLKSLSGDPAPGVTEGEIHFATIVAESVDPGTRQALTDVLEVYFGQKNTETRYESKRAEKAPWHKQWIFGYYRKWVLHVWELKGPPESWPDQLEAWYQQSPVFAVLSGVAPGGWQPIHDFCERFQLPCLFPTTDLPVIDEQDFYSMYFSRGMTLEGETIVQHLSDDDLLATPVLQVFRDGDLLGETAAAALRRSLQARGGQVKDLALSRSGKPDQAFWQSLRDGGSSAVTVLWLSESDLATFWEQLDAGEASERIYLSTRVYDGEPGTVPAKARYRVYFVHPYALPGKLPRLLLRSTGWLRVKRIYVPEEKRVQANAYFALKMAGEGVGHIRGFFSREYFLERIEHMVDNATYTSVYPRISLAPNQRFVSKGCYITSLSEDGSLDAVTDWLIPGSN
ncbi:MAG: ABC transporter substrate-binding protein [Pseudomonadota bacterium]|nr:ABC transporter substrate-binding protein [Pseudomonadota bacterium]